MSEKGLAEHYKVLKQFLVISDDLSTRTKTNSTRAARAREKLLKLSSAQFRELSTDVYDELKRRIDESRGEPDYLLPKSTFHPKRNQARQKLSSLPQSRFKDLVSDISFEIERRDLHHPSVSETTNSNSYVNNNHNKSANQTVQEAEDRQINTNTHMDESNNIYRNVDPREVDTDSKPPIRSNSSDLLNQTIGVQPKTVVPTKANLTWSSDEEEDDDQPEINKLDILVDNNNNGTKDLGPQNDRLMDLQSSHMSQAITDLKNQLAVIESEKTQLEEKYCSLQSDYEYCTSQNKTLSDEMDNLSDDKNNWLRNKSDYEKQLSVLKSDANSRSINESNNNELLQELENLKATNASLRLENHSLKNTSPREFVSPRETVSYPQRSNINSKEVPTNTSLNARNDIKKDMELFFEKLSNLDSIPVGKQQSSEEDVNDIATWQERYEALRSNQISSSLSKSILSNNDLKALVTPSGLISMKLVSDLQASIECFILIINDPKADSDLLFDKISKISLIGNDIANQGDGQYLNSNENSICLREAVSYALTATRYHAVYSDILPKIVVEQSLGEVCFIVCDLISISKLNEKSANTRNTYQNPISVLHESSKSIKDTNEIDTCINAAVRPLKMANKLRESQSQNFNSIENDAKSSTTPTRSLNDSALDAFDETPTKNKNTPSNNKINDLSPVRRGIIPSEFSTKNDQGLSKNINPSPTSRHISNLASKFEQDDNSMEKSPTDSYSPRYKKHDDTFLNIHERSDILVSKEKMMSTTPTKKSTIFDRVQQFESPISEGNLSNKYLNENEGRNNVQQHDRSLDRSLENTQNNLSTSNNDCSISNDLNEEVNNSFLVSRSSLEIRQQNQESRSDSALNSPRLENVTENETMNSNNNNEVPVAVATTATTVAAGTAFAGSRSKGLFQSIRNRIAPGSDKSSDSDVCEKDRDYGSNDSKTLLANANIPNKDGNDSRENNTTNTPDTNKDVDSKSIESESNSYTKSIESESNSYTKSINTSLQSNENESTNNNPIETRSIESNNILDDKSDLSISSTKADNMNDKQSSINLQEVEENATPMSVPDEKINKEIGKKPRGVNFLNGVDVSIDSDNDVSDTDSDDNGDPNEEQARQRQEYRKSMAAATFNIDLFDIDDPDNTLTQVLLYLEHQTVQVISTIQSLLSAIKKPSATRGDLRENSNAITEVISQMTEATNTSMNQTRNSQLKEHGSWVVKSLEDCNHRMNILCKPNADKNDTDFADKNFKQRLAGISFDIAKCTKELVKTVEEASLKEDIANLDARLSHTEDLT